MSLTELIQTEEVKTEFVGRFPKPRFKLAKGILAEPQTRNYSLVGVAFDYLLRFYVERLNPISITSCWLAEDGAWLLSVTNSVEEITDNRLKNIMIAHEIITKAKEAYEKYLKKGKHDEALLISAIQLAQLDLVYRAGILPEDFGCVNPKDVQDLRSLIEVVEPSDFQTQHYCILNPTFGEASRLVGGADADILIDQRLIEIKTTKKLVLNQQYFHQLIGYYILSRIGGIDGLGTESPITELGIYYSRYSYMWLVSLNEIADERTFQAVTERFREFAERCKSNRSRR